MNTILNAKNKSTLKIIQSWIIYLGTKITIDNFIKRSGSGLALREALVRLINAK